MVSRMQWMACISYCSLTKMKCSDTPVLDEDSTSAAHKMHWHSRHLMLISLTEV